MMPNCHWCGKSFDADKARGVNKRNTYCSRRCELAAEKNEKIEWEKRKEFWRTHRTLRILRNIFIGIFIFIAFICSYAKG